LYAKPYTGSKLLLTSAHAIDTLRALHTSGMRVIIRLAGRQENYQNADGSFSLEKWEAQIDRFRRVNLSKFIVDGTIVAHQIVSEAKAPAQWGGTIIPNDVLDEMARYSKSIWPGMETVVRTDPTDFEEDAAGIQQPWPGWQWKYLDAASPRYLARKDDVAAYFRAQQASADRQGLGVVVGLNVLSGGDGTSGVPSPTKDGAWTLSADEVRRYGSAMLTETRACAVELWTYLAGDTYFTRPEIAAAMKDLAALATSRPAYSCAQASIAGQASFRTRA
jgi:hypothetical protein